MALLAGGVNSTPQATDAGFGVELAFDANPATYARVIGLVAGQTCTFQKVYTDGNLRVLGSIGITSSADTPARDPATWTVQALVNGAWTSLQTFTREVFATRGLQRFFTLTTPSPGATGFRIVISERGDTATTGNFSAVQLAELEFHGNLITGSGFSNTLLGGINSTPNTTQAGFPIDQAFDNNTATLCRISGLAPGQSATFQKIYDDGRLRNLVAFAITSSPDTPTADPRAWTLQALVGGVWTTVGTYTGQTFSARGERRIFTPTQAVPPAAGFRIVVTERADHPNFVAVQVGEIQFEGSVVAGNPTQGALLSMANATITVSSLTGNATIDGTFPVANAIDGNTATDSRLIGGASGIGRWLITWSDGLQRRITGFEISSGNGPAEEDPYVYTALGYPAAAPVVAMNSGTIGAFSARGQAYGALVPEPISVIQFGFTVSRRAGASGTGEALPNGGGVRLSEIRLYGTVVGGPPTVSIDTGPAIVDDIAGQKVSLAGPVNLRGDAAASASVTIASDPAGTLLGPYPATIDTARTRFVAERFVADVGAGTWRATVTVSANGETASATSGQFFIDSIGGEQALPEPVITPAIGTNFVLNAAHPARAGLVAAFLTGVESSPGNVRNLVDNTEVPISLSGGAVRSVDEKSPFVLIPQASARAIITSAITRNRTAFSILSWADLDSVDALSRRPAIWWQRTPGGNVASLRRSFSGDRLVSDDVATAVAFDPTSISEMIVGGGEYPTCLDYDGTTFRLFRPGRAALAVPAAFVPADVTATLTGIAGSGDPDSDSWLGRYRGFFIWNRSRAADMQQIVDSGVQSLLSAPGGAQTPAGTAPSISTNSVLAAGTAGTAGTRQLAGSGSGTLAWALAVGAPTGFLVNASTGLLAYPANLAAGTYSIPVTLTGDTAPAATATFTITLAAAGGSTGGGATPSGRTITVSVDAAAAGAANVRGAVFTESGGLIVPLYSFGTAGSQSPAPLTLPAAVAGAVPLTLQVPAGIAVTVGQAVYVWARNDTHRTSLIPATVA